MTRSMAVPACVAAMFMCVASGVAATPAATAAPAAAWSIGSLAEPTNFSATDTQDKEEELAISATSGTYELWATNIGLNSPTAPIEWNASAEELRVALEAVPQMKAQGNVTVSGGPGGASPYRITWVGTWSGSSPGGLAATENELENGAVEGTVAQQVLQKPEAHDHFALTAINIGGHPSEGEVTIADRLPGGLVPVAMEVTEPQSKNEGECSLTELKCTYPGPVPAGHELLVEILVAVASSSLTGPLVNEATVSGGGARKASTSASNPVNVGPAPFGIAGFALEANGLDGAPDAQAGDHPYGVTTTIDLNTVLTGNRTHVAQEAKDVAVDLPLGFVGDPLATERCPEVDLTDSEGTLGSGHYRTACPAASIVGAVRLVWDGGEHPEPYPVYNVVPSHGYPAEFGFNGGLGQPIFLYASVVPGASGYRLRVATPGAIRTSQLDVESIQLAIFGNPGAENGTGGSAAFVTNPTRCSSEPASTSTEVTSWEGSSASAEATAYPEITGCNLLQGAAAFDPSIVVEPETTQADTPSGYEVALKLPQAPNVFGELATPELENATVTMPPGVSVSPSAASGPDALAGCTPAQIDLLGTELGEGHPGGNGSPYDDGMSHASPGHCPENSRLGTVKIETPLLPGPLEGHVFLAQPQCGGADQPACTEAAAEEGKVFGLYIEAAGSGVIVKLAGTVEAGGYGAHSRETGLAPGQLRAKFENNPQLPFEELRLTFTGGQRAPLANPQSCGAASATSELEPWSAPASGPNAMPSSSFTVNGCPSPMPFKPGFQAGTVTPIAGGYSPFTLQLTRQDGEQDLGGVSLTTPAGLEGMLSKVTLCGEPQAQAGTCPNTSRIGTATVASGVGSEPDWLSGPVYLTGPYRGAPFGLSIAVPAQAGPFNLGDVIVRSTISVNPHTAQLTVNSDPLPQSVDGVPFRLKTIAVTIDREGFMFNPTNCDSQTIAATITAAQGASAAVSSPFAVTGCATLPFKPSLHASTQGTTSKTNGASLLVKVTQKPGEANIRRVDLQFPKALPARLTTLHGACTEAQFNANPAGCPTASNIGTATAVTPVLNVPLSGPAYLVSHGGAAFPEVVFVLQGQGVTIDLKGATNIRGGITHSKFETVPDAPISSFESRLPEGPHSVFATNLPAKAKRSFCGRTLTIPTTIEGQNGAVIEQRTKVAVTGCSRHRRKKRRT